MIGQLEAEIRFTQCVTYLGEDVIDCKSPLHIWSVMQCYFNYDSICGVQSDQPNLLKNVSSVVFATLIEAEILSFKMGSWLNIRWIIIKMSRFE